MGSSRQPLPKSYRDVACNGATLMFRRHAFMFRRGTSMFRRNTFMFRRRASMFRRHASMFHRLASRSRRHAFMSRRCASMFRRLVSIFRRHASGSRKQLLMFPNKTPFLEVYFNKCCPKMYANSPYNIFKRKFKQLNKAQYGPIWLKAVFEIIIPPKKRLIGATILWKTKF